MNINIITKILFLKFPEKIIHLIASYFIQKISKKDIRCLCIERLLYERRLFVTEGLYSDGMFRYKLFYNNLEMNYRYFLLQIVPNLFIEYTFCSDNRINAIRFWLKEDKCEVVVDGYWIVKNNFKCIL